MPLCATAHEMATLFGTTVHVPTWWPDGADGPRYAVYFPHPDSGSQWRDYRSFGKLPGRPGRLLVIGSYAVWSQEAGEGGWFAVPELASTNGIAHEGETRNDVRVEVQGQTIVLMGFPSVADAVSTALSLQVVPTSEP